MPTAVPNWQEDHRSSGSLMSGPAIRPMLSALTDSAIGAPSGAIVQRGKKKAQASNNDNLARDLLGVGDTSRSGLHKEIKKQSKQKVQESEHMLPMAVTKQVFPGTKPDNEPTHSIAYEMHRGGQHGGGGGISSTGSSGTAKGWADHLVSLHKQGNDEEMFRQVAFDTYHSAKSTGQDPQQTMVQIQGVLNEHAKLGRLDNEQIGHIMNSVMDHHYSELERLGQL